MIDDRIRAKYRAGLAEAAPLDRTGCVSPEQLKALLEASASERQRLRDLDHVMSCTTCLRDFELLRSIGEAERFDRRRRWRLPLALAASLVGMVVAGTTWQRVRAPESPVEQRLRLEGALAVPESTSASDRSPPLLAQGSRSGPEALAEPARVGTTSVGADVAAPRTSNNVAGVAQLPTQVTLSLSTPALDPLRSLMTDSVIVPPVDLLVTMLRRGLPRPLVIEGTTATITPQRVDRPSVRSLPEVSTTGQLLLGPIGSVIEPEAFRWRTVWPDVVYYVEVFSPTRRVFDGSTPDTVLVVPDTITWEPGLTYTWQLSAMVEGRRVAIASVSFSIQ